MGPLAILKLPKSEPPRVVAAIERVCRSANDDYEFEFADVNEDYDQIKAMELEIQKANLPKPVRPGRQQIATVRTDLANGHRAYQDSETRLGEFSASSHR